MLDPSFIKNKALSIVEKKMLQEQCDCGGYFQFKAIKQEGSDPLFDPWKFVGKCPECDDEYDFEFVLGSNDRYVVVYEAVKDSNRRKGWKQTDNELLERTLGILADLGRKFTEEPKASNGN